MISYNWCRARHCWLLFSGLPETIWIWPTCIVLIYTDLTGVLRVKYLGCHWLFLPCMTLKLAEDCKVSVLLHIIWIWKFSSANFRGKWNLPHFCEISEVHCSSKFRKTVFSDLNVSCRGFRSGMNTSDTSHRSVEVWSRMESASLLLWFNLAGG